MVDINLFFITLQSERLAEPHHRSQRERLKTIWRPCTDVPNRYGTLFANQQIESLKTKSLKAKTKSFKTKSRKLKKESLKTNCSNKLKNII